MKKLLSVVTLSFLFLSIGASTVFAQPSTITTTCNGKNAAAGTICLQNPLGTINTPQALIGQIINSVLGLVGSIALLMFVYGGLTWMTSAGSAERVKKGRDILMWSAIGLVIIFSAYGLTRFVLTSIAPVPTP